MVLRTGIKLTHNGEALPKGVEKYGTTLEWEDVEICRNKGFQVWQLDFLKDDISEILPPSKMERLIIFTNPPYVKLSTNQYSLQEKYKTNDATALFYYRILKELKPTYFLLENVMMSPKWKQIITNTLGVEPKVINSSIFSIQSRNRLYWTNIPFDVNIDDKGVFFKNNYSKEYDDSLVLKGKGLNKIERPRSRVYSIDSEKLPTLLKEQESKATDSIVIKHGEVYRYPTRDEAEIMQTVPIGYTKVAKYNDAMGMLGNGWPVDVIAHIFSSLRGEEIFNNFSNENVN